MGAPSSYQAIWLISGVGQVGEATWRPGGVAVLPRAGVGLMFAPTAEIRGAGCCEGLQHG